MNKISVTLNKQGETRTFDPRSMSLRDAINNINRKGISIEEAESVAKITPGTIIKALETNSMLAPMDIYHLSEALINMPNTNS